MIRRSAFPPFATLRASPRSPLTRSRTRVKICGITAPALAQAAVDAGADAIGLVFAQSPRMITAGEAAAISTSLPPYVAAVGLFVNASAEEVRSVLAAVNLDLLQFQGDESPEFCSGFGRPFVRAVRMGAETDLLEWARRFSPAKALLLDAHVPGLAGGTGHTFDWAAIPRGCRSH